MIIYTLLFLYLTNSVLLTLNELETSSWHSANIFKLPKNLTGFLVLHSPLLLIMSYGLVELYHQSSFGYSMSSFIAVAGLLACLYQFYIKKSALSISKPVLIGIALISILQLSLTLFIG